MGRVSVLQDHSTSEVDNGDHQHQCTHTQNCTLKDGYDGEM